jgi:hypothetical protein
LHDLNQEIPLRRAQRQTLRRHLARNDRMRSTNSTKLRLLTPVDSSFRVKSGYSGFDMKSKFIACTT